MNILKTSLCFTIVLIVSCNINRRRHVIVDSEYVVGEINKDGIFDDPIKFYDTSSHKLVTEANYNKGTLEGKETDFYSNGNIKAEINYSNGKVNGFSNFYNSDGRLTQQQYNYYDLRVGPSIEYIDEKPSRFYFYSSNQTKLSLRNRSRHYAIALNINSNNQSLARSLCRI